MIKTQQYAKASPPLPSPGTKVAVLMEMKVQWEWKEEKKEGIKEGRWEGGEKDTGMEQGRGYTQKKSGQFVGRICYAKDSGFSTLLQGYSQGSCATQGARMIRCHH